MSSTNRIIACRARDPRLCPVHGDPSSILAYAREQQALNADHALKTGDFEAYVSARSAMDSISISAAKAKEPETFREALTNKFDSVTDRVSDRFDSTLDKLAGVADAVHDIHRAKEFGTVESRQKAAHDEVDTKLETAITLPSFKDIKGFFGGKS